MANARELRRQIDADPAARIEMFNYFYDQGAYGGMSEAHARILFEQQLRDPVDSGIMMQTYLPSYNTALTAQQNQNPNQPGQQLTNSAYMRRSLGKAAVIGLTGLAAIVVGSMSDNEHAKNVMEVGGTVAVAGAGVAAVASYLYAKFFR